MIDWKYWMKGNLINYNSKKESIEIMESQLQEIEGMLTGVGSAIKDGTPVVGGMSSREDMYLNLISRKDEIKFAMDYTIHELKVVDRGMNKLDDEEKSVLSRLYIQHISVEKICRDMGMDKSTLYRIANRALKNLAMNCYGSVVA